MKLILIFFLFLLVARPAQSDPEIQLAPRNQETNIISAVLFPFLVITAFTGEKGKDEKNKEEVKKKKPKKSE